VAVSPVANEVVIVDPESAKAAVARLVVS